MELRKNKNKTLRTIFISYALSLGMFIMVLILINYLMFATVGTYSADYSERVIQDHFDELKNSSQVTEDLLTPMSDFGVYSKDGDFLYGSIPVNKREKNWENYMQGKKSVNLSHYLTSIERKEEILIINYPLSMSFSNARLRKIFPNAELAFLFLLFFQLFVLIILWSNRFAKKINNELINLSSAVEKIKEQDLNFEMPTSSIKDINIILQGINKMKNSLKTALEKQWLLEKQKKEQISALAHDVRTPLTIVKGNVGLLKETEVTEEQRNYCNYIEESSSQIEKYLQSLLAITKEERSNNESKSMIYIKQLMSTLNNQGRALSKIKNINFIWNVDIKEDLYIKGNKLELERALMNILTNAVNFSPLNSMITINGSTEHSRLIIQVIDQGEGFSNKMLKYGKEQFFMENESRTELGHHGLGLYIANSIITKYNGELILANNKNNGGLVQVEIPL